MNVQSMLHYLVLVGAALQMVGIYSYVRQTLKGTTKPNKITWLMWAVAPLIASAASLSTGVTWAAVPVFMAGFSPLFVLAASFANRRSYWKLGAFDYACGVFSLLALVLWFETQNPNIAIIFAMLSDALAAVPTLAKAWVHPETESAGPFTFGVLNGLTSFAAITVWSFAAYAFPVYLVLVSALLSTVVLRKKLRTFI